MRSLRDATSHSVVITGVAMAVGLILTAACGLKAMEKPIIVSDCDRQITLTRGNELVVRLEGAAMAGYIWKVVSYNPALLEYPGASEIQQKEKVDAEGGLSYQLFRFRAVAAGRDTVLFRYRHFAKKDRQPSKTCLIHVNIVE